MVSNINYSNISSINYRDLSEGRASDIVRQLQQIKEDARVSANSITDELKKPKGNLNSPYAPDRAGTQNILG